MCGGRSDNVGRGLAPAVYPTAGEIHMNRRFIHFDTSCLTARGFSCLPHENPGGSKPPPYAVGRSLLHSHEVANDCRNEKRVGLAIRGGRCYNNSRSGKQVQVLHESVAVWRRTTRILTRGPHPGDRSLAQAEKAGCRCAEVGISEQKVLKTLRIPGWDNLF